MKTVAFYFPYYEVSGVPVLFSNLADYFSKNYQFKISIIDFEEGYMSSSLKGNNKIEKIVFETSKPLLIDVDIVIMQSILPFAMRPEIKFSDDTRIMFWNLHPDNLIPNLFPFTIVRKYYPNIYRNILSIFWNKKLKLTKEFVKNAIKSNSLLFMDSANLNNTNFFLSTEINNSFFLPIACSNGVKREDQINKNVDKQTLLVSESTNLASSGAIINFIFKDSKLKFELNKTKAQKNDLKVGQYLTKLAYNTI